MFFVTFQRRHKSLKDGLTCKVVQITDGSGASSPVNRSVSQLIANSMVRILECVDDTASDTVV